MMRRASLFLLIMLVFGCTVGPDYKRPVVPVPKQWSEAIEAKELHLKALPDKWWQGLEMLAPSAG
ncbi:MAG: hypothetical protein PHG00_08015 [Methylococcales bacterium]|nr:hypothetical protein [Methylococcales bacterium]